jgi:hypothetical protein
LKLISKISFKKKTDSINLKIIIMSKDGICVVLEMDITCLATQKKKDSKNSERGKK